MPHIGPLGGPPPIPNQPDSGPVGNPPPLPQQPHGFKDTPQPSNTLQTWILNAISLVQGGNKNGALSQINQLLQLIGTMPSLQNARDSLLAARSMILANALPAGITTALQNAYLSANLSGPKEAMQLEIMNALQAIQSGNMTEAVMEMRKVYDQLPPGTIGNAVKNDLTAAASLLMGNASISQITPYLKDAYNLIGQL